MDIARGCGIIIESDVPKVISKMVSQRSSTLSNVQGLVKRAELVVNQITGGASEGVSDLERVILGISENGGVG